MNPQIDFPYLFAQTTKWALIALCAVSLVIGCGADAADADGSPSNDAEAAPAEDIVTDLHEAEIALEEHRVSDAHSAYARALERNPDHGAAAAGMAVTELLLLLEMDEVTQLLIENLGARSGIDADTVIYGEGGYLYWASRGARWTDDGQYDGIRSILADDLPWSVERLEALPFFVEGLDEPVHKLIRQLVTVANALRGIDHHLEVAIAAEDFSRLYVPGEVFYDADLTLRLGRSELAILRSLLALTRGVIYFLAAYDHDWTLDQAFGPWRFDVALDNPDYVQGFGPIDYSVDYLDRHLFRSVTNADRLSASRSALRDSITHARSAIVLGLEDPYTTTMSWDDIDSDDAYELDLLLEAYEKAFDGPTEIPFTEPAPVTLDLSPLFDDEGRVLHEDMPWFVRQSGLNGQLNGMDSLENAGELWSVNDEAFETFWVDGIVDTSVEYDEIRIDVGPDGGDISEFIDVLMGTYRQNVEDIYFSTR